MSSKIACTPSSTLNECWPPIKILFVVMTLFSTVLYLFIIAYNFTKHSNYFDKYSAISKSSQVVTLILLYSPSYK